MGYDTLSQSVSLLNFHSLALFPSWSFQICMPFPYNYPLIFSLVFRTVSTVGRCVLCVCARAREAQRRGFAPWCPCCPRCASVLLPTVRVRLSQRGPLGDWRPRLGTGPSYPPSASHLSFCHLNLWKSARRQPFRKTKEKKNTLFSACLLTFPCYVHLILGNYLFIYHNSLLM